MESTDSCIGSSKQFHVSFFFLNVILVNFIAGAISVPHKRLHRLHRLTPVTPVTPVNTGLHQLHRLTPVTPVNTGLHRFALVTPVNTGYTGEHRFAPVTPVNTGLHRLLLRTTKYYSSTTPYYKVLISVTSVNQRNQR